MITLQILLFFCMAKQKTSYYLSLICLFCRPALLFPRSSTRKEEVIGVSVCIGGVAPWLIPPPQFTLPITLSYSTKPGQIACVDTYNTSNIQYYQERERERETIIQLVWWVVEELPIRAILACVHQHWAFLRSQDDAESRSNHI